MNRRKRFFSFNLFLKITLFGLIAAGLIIVGLLLSNQLDQRFRKRIDKNGKLVRAEISKRSRKITGSVVHYNYFFKNKTYHGKEGNLNYYYQLRTGDSIQIKLDTTNPGNSYIYSITP